MASERNDDDIDFDYWDNLIKETEDIDELKSFKGQNSIIDGLIDEELVNRGELVLDTGSEDNSEELNVDPFAPPVPRDPNEPLRIYMGDGMYLDPRIGADENPKYLIKDDDGNDLYVDSLAPGSPPGTPRPQSPRTPREPPPWWQGPDPREDPPQPEVEEEPEPVIRNLDEEQVDEDIDEDFIINEGDEEDHQGIMIEKSEKDVFDKKVFDEDTYLIIFKEEEDELIDKLLSIKEINQDQNEILTIDEEGNTIRLYLDDKSKKIMLKTDDYEIVDMEKVEEFDLNDLEEEDLLLTKNIYPEIELYVEEIKNKKYSLHERKEDFISEMISLFKAYNNEKLTLDICNYADTFIDMYESNRLKTEIKDKNIHPFIKEIIQENKINFPQWILPIVTNIKKLYKEEDEDFTEYDDIENIKYEDEFLEMQRLFNDIESQKTYKISVKLLDNYPPFINKSIETILPYEGHYLRSCSDKEPCHGLLNDYNLELNKTRSPLLISKMKDYKTFFEVIRSEEELSITGMYTLPYPFLNYTFKNNDTFNLIEYSQLCDFKHSYLQFKERFNHNSVIPHIVGSDTIKEDFWNEAVHSYLFNDSVKNDNLYEVLKNNFPSVKDMIDSIPKRMINNIFNQNDFDKLLHPYGIKFNLLDTDEKKLIQENITKNIKEYIKKYNKLVKRKVIKNVKKKDIILSTDDKIKLAKEFIFSLFIIPIKNNYIERFIKKFGREDITKDEDPNYIYQKNSDKKLLCKHYKYSTKIHKNPEYHNLLLNNFGGTVSDGLISCKVCGEYLCHEDFSLLEGFGENDKPINTREELITDEDELKALSEKEIDIKKKIGKISSLLSIELTYGDKQSIIDYINLVNHDELIDIRYDENEYSKKHPLYNDIKKKYPSVKQIRTKEDQLKNKENKKLREKELTIFKEYLINCNELFIITFFILFHIQTSNPPYSIKSKENIYLWDPDYFVDTKWNKEKYNIHEKISMNTVELMINIFDKVCSSNKTKFWKNIKVLLNEKGNYEEVTNFKEQFIYSASYFLRNSNVRDKLKNYHDLRNNIGQSLYLRERWSSYRPLPDNETIVSINEKVSEQLLQLKTLLLKRGGDIKYENISSIQSINDAFFVPKFKYYEIPYSDILKNEAYERLFNYCVHLHGKSDNQPLLNLLINNLLETIDDSDMIENMIVNAGWNKDKKELDYIDFTELKRVIIVEITEYFKNKNENEKNTINTYIHIHFNNWNGMLLNGHSKRDYSYTPPNVFPNESFEELLNTEIKKEGSDEKTNIIKEVLKKYCLDENGEINERYSIDDFILNLVADPSLERDATCFKKIEETKKNFELILEYKVRSNMLKTYNFEENIEISLEKKINQFVKFNNLNKYPMEDTYELFEGLKDLVKVKKSSEDILNKEYRRLFNMMLTFNNDNISKIIKFLNNSYEEEYLDRSHISRTPTKSFDGLAQLLSKFLEDTKSLDSNVYNLKYILSRLSTYNEYTPGILFSKHIPPQWKLSDTNKDNLTKFLDDNEFLLHNDIFIDKKYSTYKGFYEYMKQENYSICIGGLLSYINDYYKSGIEKLSGDDKEEYTTNYSHIFKKFIFLFIFSKMIDYVDSLKDTNSEISREANSLFLALEEKDRLENEESIKLCSHLIFDLLIHFIEDFFDTGWINQSELISEKLSRQKEQEKQSIINDLEAKTNEERGVETELQKIGVKSYFKDKSISNLEDLKTQDYKNQTTSERIERLKELFNSDSEMLEMMEMTEPNILSKLQEDTRTKEEAEEEEGYSQYDQDREDEGLDDADEDGNYRED